MKRRLLTYVWSNVNPPPTSGEPSSCDVEHESIGGSVSRLLLDILDRHDDTGFANAARNA